MRTHSPHHGDHDHRARQLVRRHENEQQWARQRHAHDVRKRQEAIALLNASPFRLFRRSFVIGFVGLAMLGVGFWFAYDAHIPDLPERWADLVAWLSFAAGGIALLGCFDSARSAIARRARARSTLHHHPKRNAVTRAEYRRSVEELVTVRVHGIPEVVSPGQSQAGASKSTSPVAPVTTLNI